MHDPPRQPTESRVRRVVLALDPDGHAGAAAEMAMALARHFAADLLGVTIEDEALLRAAALPFATEVGRESGVERKLDTPALEKRLQRAARQLHETLLSLTPTGNPPTTIRSARCRLPSLLQDYGTDADVLIFGRAPDSRWRPAGSPVRLESPAMDSAGFDAIAYALRAWTAAEPWERMPWLDDEDALLRLRRRHPTLVLTGAAVLSEPRRLRRLIDALDCPVVVFPDAGRSRSSPLTG